MAISFACACGKKFTVKDELAGKKSKCPACGAGLTVPPPAVEDDGFEVMDDEPAPAAADEDEIVMEVVEPGAAPAKAQPAGAKAADQSKPGDNPFDFNKATKTKKKKKKKRKTDDEEEGSMTAMYMAEARDQERKDEARAKAAGDWGGEEYGGKTLFGVHLSGGVISGASMLVIGLISMACIFLFKGELGPGYFRIFIGAIVCTGLGLLQLLRAFMGDSED